MNNLYRFFCSVACFFTFFACNTCFAGDITGAGASFPAVAFEKWGSTYTANAYFGLHYQSLNSGEGIRQIVGKFVDFGASDVPLSAEELSAKSLVQFPVLMGGIVPVVNLAAIGPGQLKLSGEVLADIYLGKITKWNDTKIAADNNGLLLPDQAISVVYRSDESGSAYVFTSYLAQVSSDWKRNVGVGKTVKWPLGVGGKGNDGAASYVHRLQGAIGFVEYATVMQDKLAYVQLKNRDGQFVSPSADTIRAAAAHKTWDVKNGFSDSVINQPGKDTWPLTTTTFVVLQKVQSSAERGSSVLNFFDWSLRDGTKLASDLGYVTLPETVVKLIHDAWKTQVVDTAGHVLWKN